VQSVSVTPICTLRGYLESPQVIWRIEARSGHHARVVGEESVSIRGKRTILACASGFYVDLRPRTFRIASKSAQ
jgi:hypothetical protein